MVLYASTTVITRPVMLRSMFLPAGETFMWFERNIRIPMHRRAISNAPFRRHGRLKRSMHSRSIGTNQYLIRIRLWNTAPYATIVHEGTEGMLIEGKPWLWVGVQSAPPAGWTKPKRIIEVRGQKAQPFMRDAMEWSLHRKGLL